MLIVLVVLLSISMGGQTLAVLIRALIGVAALLMFAAILTLTQPHEGSPRYGRWMIAVLGVVAVDLGIASWGLNPTTFGENRVVREEAHSRSYLSKRQVDDITFSQFFRFDNYQAPFNLDSLIRSGLPNANIYRRAPMLNNFEPLLVGHFARMIELIEAHPDPELLLQAAGVTSESDLRVWFAESVCWHESQAELEAALVDPAWNPYRQMHVLGDAGCPQVSESSEDATVTLTDHVNTVTISVNAPQAGWLVLADTDYPGWKATIDGEPVPIYRANLMFRAVQVDAGLQEVVFRYEPDWLAPALLITVVSLVVLLFLFRLAD